MKSQLIFLTELLLIAGLVIIVTSAGYRQVSSDGHIYTFEITNLPLFLERAATIQENFEYKYAFQQETSLEIKEGIIALDRPRREKKRFYQATKLNLQEIHFENVTQIYVSKEGDTIYISEQEKKINSLYKTSTLKPERLFFYSDDEVISDFVASRDIFTVLPSIRSDLDKPIIIFQESEKNEKILYTIDAVNIAQAIANKYADASISMYPIQEEYSVVRVYTTRGSINTLVRIYG